MDALKLTWLLVLLALLAPGAGTTAQSPPELVLAAPVDGRVDVGASESWLLNAPEGAVLSFIVEATSPEFDPVLSIQNSAGVALIANDDYQYPDEKDAIIEAVTIPRRDSYTVTVSGFGDTAGTYTLIVLPGYGQIGEYEDFDAENIWRRQQDELTLEILDGQLTLALTGIGQTGSAFNPESAAFKDFYAQVHVTDITNRNGWYVGLALRQSDPDTYYSLEMSYQGFWRLVWHSAEESRIVRDWVTHPAIIPGEFNFTLGVLARGGLFDVFYNGQYVGQAADRSPAGAGQVGLMIGTVNALGSETVARFDDLLVTVPLLVDKGLLPNQVIVGNSPMSTVQDLQRQYLIPTQGEMAMIVSSSFVTGVRPGVNRIRLGQGGAYRNFVLGTRVMWQTASSGTTGCGLVFHDLDDTHYTLAYVDQTGGFGISQREGDTFLPGIFGESGTPPVGQQNLLIIANDTTIDYYVNGAYVGTAQTSFTEGGVGNAVVNFEGIDTTCEFSDTWLWYWE